MPSAAPQQADVANGRGERLDYLDRCVVIIFSSAVRPQKIPRYDCVR
jgi:hypothetical protein